MSISVSILGQRVNPTILSASECYRGELLSTSEGVEGVADSLQFVLRLWVLGLAFRSFSFFLPVRFALPKEE